MLRFNFHWTLQLNPYPASPQITGHSRKNSVCLIYLIMEDAFAELVLMDPEDERPEMTSREARIARAFTESKKNYASEIVVTPPGVR